MDAEMEVGRVALAELHVPIIWGPVESTESLGHGVGWVAEEDMLPLTLGAVEMRGTEVKVLLVEGMLRRVRRCWCCCCCCCCEEEEREREGRPGEVVEVLLVMMVLGGKRWGCVLNRVLVPRRALDGLRRVEGRRGVGAVGGSWVPVVEQRGG